MPSNLSDELLARRRARRNGEIHETATVDGQPPVSLAIENPPTAGELGGDCLCGRGPAIGTCVVTASRLWFRAFHEAPAAYHLERCTEWACIDCVADAALDVAKGVVRERMRESARRRSAS